MPGTGTTSALKESSLPLLTKLSRASPGARDGFQVVSIPPGKDESPIPSARLVLSRPIVWPAWIGRLVGNVSTAGPAGVSDPLVAPPA
jgi:hypothetical protein